MNLPMQIALRHILARKRQSLVSISGIVLGVAFFLAVSSMMRGSQNDFIRRLVDNSPHITISDEFRSPRTQPAERVFETGAVEVRRVKPLSETRGVRGYGQILAYLRTLPGVRASATLAGQALVSFAGREEGVTLNGMIPADMRTVTTVGNYMTRGSVDDLVVNPDGLIVGEGLARRLSLNFGDTITLASVTGQVRVFKIIGLFRTGRANYDNSQTFADLKRVQALLNRNNRVNNILVKMDDPYQARVIASQIENQIGYKSMSWQESSEDIMNTLAIRNAIMYTVVSAVLVVAAFGIYNVISTIVLEKQRDIAILKSIGLRARDIRQVFLIQGIILGVAGCLGGIPLGAAFMGALQLIRFRPPGGNEVINMPIDWGVPQFLIAVAFAMSAALLASFLPARKGAAVQPIDILRGRA